MIMFRRWGSRTGGEPFVVPYGVGLARLGLYLFIVLLLLALSSWGGLSPVKAAEPQLQPPNDQQEQPQNPPEVSTFHSNGFKFVFTKRYYIDSDRPADTILVIYNTNSQRPVERLVFGSWTVDVMEDENLSKDYMVLREWNGGAFCCWIVHAFRTEPSFKRLLRHNNQSYKPEDIFISKDKLELHDNDSAVKFDKAYGGLVYTPREFDLRTEAWGQSRIASLNSQSSTQSELIEIVLRELEDKAEQGDIHALYRLAYRYSRGQGIKKDHEVAAKLFLKGAELGHAGSQYQIGLYYFVGVGVEEDFDKALKWIGKSAFQGEPDAQHFLVRVYLGETGLKPDHKEAFLWTRFAAKNGIVQAQFDVGNYYWYGTGVSRDYSKAVKWFKRAAGNGHNQSRYFLGLARLKGVGLSKNDLTASKWFRLATNQGSLESSVELAKLYLHGRGVERSWPLAEQWFYGAAKRGSPEAAYYLGIVSLFGISASADESEAAGWFEKADEKGDPFASYFLGMMYEKGRGVKQDAKKASEWFEKAGKNSDPKFLIGLALLHDSFFEKVESRGRILGWMGEAASKGLMEAQYAFGGMLLKENKDAGKPEEGLGWIRKAAVQGMSKAQYTMGWHYFHGEIIPEDFDKAVVWYRKSAEQGHAQAQVSYGVMMAEGLGGLEKDPVSGLVWINIGNSTDGNLGTKVRDLIEQKLTDDEIEEAERRAKDWIAANPLSNN
jgi:TPR repeat protein